MQSKNIDFDKIVCDNGSGFLKMGFAGDSFPRYTIPSIVGRPMLKFAQSVEGVELKDEMFGDEANPLRSLLDIKYPIEEGQVRDWNDFEKLWKYTFHSKMGLSSDLKDKGIIVTEAAVQPRKNRDMMAEKIFETFGFGSCLFETQALLSLMAEGHSSGLVLDSGDGVTHVIPVIEGQV